MRAKFLTLLAALFLIAACETAPEAESGADSGGASNTTSTATTSTESQPLPGPAPGSQEQLTVQVGDRVFYAYDSSDLNAESQNTLQGLAAWMTTYQGVIITVEGHADERGTREYNLALGARRASSARDYLIALGVNPNRIDTISYGKERPAVLGSNESAWAQNRRGVFLVN